MNFKYCDFRVILYYTCRKDTNKKDNMQLFAMFFGLYKIKYYLCSQIILCYQDYQ